MSLFYDTKNPCDLRSAKPSKKKKRWSEVTPTSFGQFCCDFRDKLGFTQAEMTTFLNVRCRPHITVDLRRYQRWERGKSLVRFLTPDNIFWLSNALHVPVQDIVKHRRIPSMWHPAGLLHQPPREVQSDTEDPLTYVYTVHTDRDVHTVIAYSETDAQKVFVAEGPDEEIRSVKPLRWCRGIVVKETE